MIVTVSEDEEHILMDIQQNLQSKATYVAIHSEQNMIFSFPNFEIDLYHREVWYNNKLVRLTNIEFRILHYLASQPGRVFTYQQIYEAVWGEEYIHEKGIIMTHIRHIRQKLEAVGDSFNYIENIRGVGYRLKKPMTDSS